MTTLWADEWNCFNYTEGMLGKGDLVPTKNEVKNDQGFYIKQKIFQCRTVSSGIMLSGFEFLVTKSKEERKYCAFPNCPKSTATDGMKDIQIWKEKEILADDWSGPITPTLFIRAAKNEKQSSCDKKHAYCSPSYLKFFPENEHSGMLIILVYKSAKS